MVITNDIALETAINMRIDTARIGRLAYTPQHIATHLGARILGRPLVSDLELISKVSEETGKGIRQVYSEIQNFREIRKHKEDVGAYIYTKESRRIYDSYKAMPTLEKALGELDPEDERYSDYFGRPKRIAIIGSSIPEDPEVGTPLFNNLDRHCNLSECDADYIDIFTDGTFEIDTIYEVGNDRQLAENAAELIDPAKATDYAIVLNAGGSIADAVRSSLYRRDIPFKNNLNVRDLAQVRDFLSFITLSHSYRTLRVRTVKELFSNYNGFFEKGREDYLLHRQGPEDMKKHAEELREVMRRIYEDGMTFTEVRDAICDDRARIQVTTLLKALNMEDTLVTPDSTSELRFAVDNVQELKHNEQLPDSEKKGVIIVDCKNSLFVDRPVIIYLGMEQDWNIPVVGRRYLDSEDESRKNALRLEAQLQQGQKRIYLVNSSKSGRPVRPCLMFDTLFDKPCERFSDICRELRTGRWARPMEEVFRVRGEDSIDPGRRFDRDFSKSSFNDYVACPRRYMFSALLTTPDALTTEFGNLIHDFAELYACYPEVVNERGIDMFVDLISDRYAGLSSPLMAGIDHDRIRLAMDNVKRFLDTNGVRVPCDVPNASRKYPNRFLTELGLENGSRQCEYGMEYKAHHLYGKFDLIWKDEIYDYKTGRPHRTSRMVKDMDLLDVAAYPEFQPLIYLAIARHYGLPEPRFHLNYIMDGGAESSKDDFDHSRSMRSVTIHKGSLLDIIRGSRDVRLELESILKESMKPYAGLVIDSIDDDAPEDPSVWKDDNALIGSIVTGMGRKGKTAEKDASMALKKLSGLIQCGIIVTSTELHVPEHILEGFLETVDRMHEEVVRGYHEGLAPEPRGNIECRDCDYFEACTRDIVRIQGGEGVE